MWIPNEADDHSSVTDPSAMYQLLIAFESIKEGIRNKMRVQTA